MGYIYTKLTTNPNPNPPWKIEKPILIPEYEKNQRTPEGLAAYIKERRLIERKRLFLYYQEVPRHERHKLEMALWIIDDTANDREDFVFTPRMVAIDPETVRVAFACVKLDRDKVTIAEYFRKHSYCCEKEDMTKVLGYMDSEEGKEYLEKILSCSSKIEASKNFYYRTPEEQLPKHVRVSRDNIKPPL